MRAPFLSPARRILSALALGVAAMGATVPEPQEMPLPMDLQVSMLARIWAYDRSHRDRFAEGLVVAVVYQELFRPSLVAKNEFLRVVRARDWGPHAVHVVDVEIDDTADFESALREEGVDVVYLAPLRGRGIDEVVRATRRAGTLTCTGVPGYVAQGVSVGLDSEGDKPRILVNLTGAKAEGADFSSELLKLAYVVEEG